MVEVVCISHGGIRCGIPSTQIAAFRPVSVECEAVSLWPEHSSASTGLEHFFELLTPEGPRLVRGRGVRVIQLQPDAIRAISPFLRHFMTLPHVVGLSEVDGEVVWLVDAKRFRAPSRSSSSPASFSGHRT
jgi:hypothetical protein